MLKVLSLFDGIGSGYEALERAGFEIDTYVAYEIDKNAIKIALKNHPKIIEMGDVTKADFSQYKGFDLVIGGSPCFIAGTLVITQRGTIPIEEIQIGDEVLTHTNSFHKVTATMKHQAKGLYTVYMNKSCTFTATGNHRLYIRDRERVWDNSNRNFKWNYSKPYWKRIDELTGHEMILNPVNKIEENKYELTDDECWLIGRYVADGYQTDYQRNDRPSRLKTTQFCIGKKKTEEFKTHIKNIKIHCSIERTINRYGTYDKRIFELCKECGQGAANKKIPSYIMNLPINKLKLFLDGYLSGDGCYDKKNNKYKLTSVSKILVYQLKDCVLKCFGTPASIWAYKRPNTCVIEGRVVNQKDTWNLSFAKEVRKQNNSKMIDKELWTPITKIIYEPDREEYVYNMEVEIDNSYTANGYAVHNCTGFSVAGKGLNFNDPQSKLFFEYEKAIKQVEPKYFLLENVAMKQEWQDVITGYLGVEPILINSNLVSAQNRKRLYWTNIPGVTLPEDKGIMLADIVHENEPDYQNKYNLEPYKVPIDKTFQIIEKEVQRGKIGYFRKDCQANRVYSIHGKAVTLCGDAGGGAAKMGQYLFGCITPDRINKRQNGQRFNEGDKFYTLTGIDKHGILTDGYIRKLTPIETERLQTLPDNYTLCDGVSENARYRATGLGWTVDVIAHIFNFMKEV